MTRLVSHSTAGNHTKTRHNRSFDTCPECGSRVIVVNSRLLAGFRVRYYGCRQCGYRPDNNKVVTNIVAASSTNTCHIMSTNV